MLATTLFRKPRLLKSLPLLLATTLLFAAMLCREPLLLKSLLLTALHLRKPRLLEPLPLLLASTLFRKPLLFESLPLLFESTLRNKSLFLAAALIFESFFLKAKPLEFGFFRSCVTDIVDMDFPEPDQDAPTTDENGSEQDFQDHRSIPHHRRAARLRALCWM